MVTSVDVGKASDKLQHSFMITTLRKQGSEGVCSGRQEQATRARSFLTVPRTQSARQGEASAKRWMDGDMD